MSLKTMMAEARNNEAKLERLQAMEFRFLDAASLEALCAAVVEDYRDTFSLSVVNLFLFDWDGALARFLEEAEIAARRGVHVVEAGQAEQLTALCSDRPWLGPFEDRLHHRHFPLERHRLGSVALLPLRRRGKHIGLLVFGSEDATRFEPDLGTEFLQRLTAIIAICIENSLNFERLRQLGLRDPLTHLYNRRYFLERLLQAMNIALRSQVPISCLYLDIDHFKRINDSRGHPIGDAVLCEVARRLSRQLRIGEVLARLGGEEFAVMLVGTAQDEARAVAERMRRAVGGSDIRLAGAEGLRVSVSGGVAEWRPSQAPATTRTVDDLVARADRALFTAKAEGRDRIVADSAGAGAPTATADG